MSHGPAGTRLVRQLPPLVSLRRLVSARPVLAALGPFLSALVTRTGWYSARPVARATGLAPRWLVSADSARVGLSPLVQLGPRHSPRSAARVRPLASTGSARAAPLASFRSSGQGTGLHWFSSGRATRLAPQLGSPLCALAARSPLCALVARLSPLVARPKVSCRAGLVAGSPCPDGLPPLFLSAAQSPARANSTGIRSLSSVPHLWSSSFDCPASPGKEKTKCGWIAPRTHSDGPVSPTCLLTTLKGES